MRLRLYNSQRLRKISLVLAVIVLGILIGGYFTFSQISKFMYPDSTFSGSPEIIRFYDDQSLWYVVAGNLKSKGHSTNVFNWYARNHPNTISFDLPEPTINNPAVVLFTYLQIQLPYRQRPTEIHYYYTIRLAFFPAPDFPWLSPSDIDSSVKDAVIKRLEISN